MIDTPAAAHLRKLAHRHVDAMIDAWPEMIELRYTPDIPRPDPDDGAQRQQGVHSDPTASVAVTRVDAGPDRCRANPAAAWLNEATKALMHLAELDAGQDDMLGHRPAACAVCHTVIGRRPAVAGCHRACYDARRKQRNRDARRDPFGLVNEKHRNDTVPDLAI